MDWIDTCPYKYFKINKKSLNDPKMYKLGCEMIDTWDEIHRKTFKKLRKLFIPLCLESHNGYYINILRIYDSSLSFVRGAWNICHGIFFKNRLNDHIFIKNKISKWDNDIICKEILGCNYNTVNNYCFCNLILQYTVKSRENYKYKGVLIGFFIHKQFKFLWNNYLKHFYYGLI